MADLTGALAQEDFAVAGDGDVAPVLEVFFSVGTCQALGPVEKVAEGLRSGFEGEVFDSEVDEGEEDGEGRDVPFGFVVDDGAVDVSAFAFGE